MMSLLWYCLDIARFFILLPFRVTYFIYITFPLTVLSHITYNNNTIITSSHHKTQTSHDNNTRTEQQYNKICHHIQVNSQLIDTHKFKTQVDSAKDGQTILLTLEDKSISPTLLKNILLESKVKYQGLKFDKQFPAGDLATVLAASLIVEDPNLKIIDLRQQKLGLAALVELNKALPHSKALEILILAENEIISPPNPLSNIINCPKLVHLDLSYCSLKDEALAGLMQDGNFRKLKILNLEGNELTGSCFKNSGYLDLETINLSKNKIPSANLISILGSFFSATSLILSDNSELFSSPDVIERLASSDGLDAWEVRNLSISHTGISEESLIPLIDALIQLENLAHLDMSRNSFCSEKSTKFLVQLVENSRSLTRLDLSGCCLSAPLLDLLTVAFHGCIRADFTLDLSCNGVEGLSLLCR